MKMKKILALVLAAVMALALVACGGGNNAGNPGATPGNNTQKDDNANAGEPSPDAGGSTAGETISLTLWGAEEDQSLLVDLVEKFKAAYPDQTFDIKVGVESESTAKDTILTDIEAAADVFAFANDQIDDLIAAGALLPISGDMDAVLQNYAGKTIADIQSANRAATVATATRNDTLYAFPMGGGNNYFLYYDSTRVSAEQAQSWDTLLEAAQAAGRFDDEIVPVPVKVKKDIVEFKKDEYPKAGVTAEGIAKLRGAFPVGPEGVEDEVVHTFELTQIHEADARKHVQRVTAANASGINDGAAAIVLASGEAVEKYGLKPMAKLVSWGHGGVDPKIMGVGPVPASRDAMAKANLTIKDIDLVEANEAFAAQSLGCLRELGMDMGSALYERVNVNGGAIALGHALGNSGTRILTTLIYEMGRRQVRFGIATLCIGGGQGMACLVELAQ